MPIWYAEVEVTISTVYKKLVPIERYDMWDPSDLGKPKEGEDQIDVNNRLFSEEEEQKLFDPQDLKTFKQEQECDFQVLSINRLRKDLV